MGIDDIICAYICLLILTCLENVAFIQLMGKVFLKSESLIAVFPTWKETKKPFYWFVFWSVIKCTNIVVFTTLWFMYANILGSRIAAIAIFAFFLDIPISIIIYFIFECIIAIIYRIIYKIRKIDIHENIKNEQNSDAEVQ